MVSLTAETGIFSIFVEFENWNASIGMLILELYGWNFDAFVGPNNVIIGISEMDNKWPQPESFAIPNRLCFDKKYVCAAVGVLINLFCRGKIEKGTSLFNCS